jgi:hypothetical protein
VYPQEKVAIPIEWEVWWVRELVWIFGEQKTLLLLPGFEPWIIQPIA